MYSLYSTVCTVQFVGMWGSADKIKPMLCIRVFQKNYFSLICKCKQMGAVYGPYEVNKKRIGNKSLKHTKRAMVFNIQRKSEKRRGKSHRLAFSILKKICACFDGSVSAAQFLTSRRFRRHPYQYDLCPSSDICHRWQNDIIDKCQRWQMTDGGNKSDWYGCLRKRLDVRNWSANTEPSEQAQIFFKMENAERCDFSPTFFIFPLYIEKLGAFHEFQTFITNSFFIDFIWYIHR